MAISTKWELDIFTAILTVGVVFILLGLLLPALPFAIATTFFAIGGVLIACCLAIALSNLRAIANYFSRKKLAAYPPQDIYSIHHPNQPDPDPDPADNAQNRCWYWLHNAAIGADEKVAEIEDFLGKKSSDELHELLTHQECTTIRQAAYHRNYSTVELLLYYAKLANANTTATVLLAHNFELLRIAKRHRDDDNDHYLLDMLTVRLQENNNALLSNDEYSIFHNVDLTQDDAHDIIELLLNIDNGVLTHQNNDAGSFFQKVVRARAFKVAIACMNKANNEQAIFMLQDNRYEPIYPFHYGIRV